MGIARDWEKRVIWTNITYAKRTVRIFSVSLQSRSLSSASFQTFGLTALASHALRACEARARKTLTPRFTEFFSDFEKKKKPTVLQSKRHSKTLRPLSWSETLCSNSVDNTRHSTLCSAIVKIIFVSQEPQCLLVYTCFKKSLGKKHGQMSVVVKYM